MSLIDGKTKPSDFAIWPEYAASDDSMPEAVLSEPTRAPRRKVNDRGIGIYLEFSDERGTNVGVSDSLAAGAVPYVWLRVDGEQHSALHLTPSEARELAAALVEFADRAEDGDGDR